MADIVFKVSPHGRAVFDKLESGMGTSESTERGTNSVSDSDESTWRTLVLPTKYVRYKRVLEGRKLTDDLTQEALEKMLKRWSKKRRGGRSRLSSMPVGGVQPVKLEGLKAKGAKEYDTILSMCDWIVDEHHKYRPEKCCEFASVDKVGRQFAENGHFYYLDFLVKDLENDGNPLVPVEAVIYRRVPDDFKLWKCHGLKACNMLGADCQHVSRVIGNDLNLILRNLLQGIVALIYLLVLSWPLGLCTLAICSTISILMLLYGR
ncbi:unnamed protein product [Cuscuta epithymum]|uniref:ABC transmembrane type-1 domain-containing protein n=1 Tax=Cuscuta epithymum TaxID=186058 RepID=A0AAV0F8V2_9ASTE|nr:unnamed protein product [Cuscuta epithymum]